MPYIPPERRAELLPAVQVLPETPGELNFLICHALIWYVRSRGLSYQTLNDVQGVLKNVSAEFDARVTRPYEERKADENGDLPWPA